MSLINDDEELKIQEENESHEQEDEINSSEFHRKVDSVMISFAEYLKSNRKTISSFFGDRHCIYLQELNEGNMFQAIRLSVFGKELSQVGIQIDEITLNCLFVKFKFSDEIESIDVNLLREEMECYGIIEVSNEPEKEKKKEEFFFKLGEFLKQKNLKLSSLFEGKLDNVEINYKKIEVVKNTEVIKLLKENGVTFNEQSTKQVLELYCNPEFKGHVFFARLKSALEFYYKKVKKVKERPGENYEKDKKNKNNSAKMKELEDNLNANDVPNADSKVFNESLNDDDKLIENEKNNIIDFEKGNEGKFEMANIIEQSHEDSSRSKIL